MPTPSFTVITWTLLQQSMYVRKLVLKHGLDALVLRLDLAVKLLRLSLHLGLKIGDLLRLVMCELLKLSVNLSLLLHQLMYLTFKCTETIRNVILLHGSSLRKLGQYRSLNTRLHLLHAIRLSSCRGNWKG